MSRHPSTEAARLADLARRLEALGLAASRLAAGKHDTAALDGKLADLRASLAEAEALARDLARRRPYGAGAGGARSGVG